MSNQFTESSWCMKGEGVTGRGEGMGQLYIDQACHDQTLVWAIMRGLLKPLGAISMRCSSGLRGGGHQFGRQLCWEMPASRTAGDIESRRGGRGWGGQGRWGVGYCSNRCAMGMCQTWLSDSWRIWTRCASHSSLFLFYSMIVSILCFSILWSSLFLHYDSLLFLFYDSHCARHGFLIRANLNSKATNACLIVITIAQLLKWTRVVQASHIWKCFLETELESDTIYNFLSYSV